MPTPVGTRLGPYEILALLGAGGMGEVYKARDTRLDRMVAVKIATQKVSERFTREARAVAALNHPNIVALFDVGENYIVTELVEGESLRAAQLSPRRAVEIAAQIADGLAAAHAAGIAHRDLKPENVMITRDGRAKILDFGLSRQYAGAGANDSTQTLPGTVMGTVGYMSPEQVRGQDADHRSDIFSFGVMLYEMLAGKRAFVADTAAEVMTSILKQDPPELPPSLPAPWREVVRHCLEKEPAARFQSAKDLSFALRSLLLESGISGPRPPVPLNKPRRWMGIAAVIALVAAAFALGWLMNRRNAFDLASYRFTPIASEAGAEVDPVWSPDGKSLAYAAMTGHGFQIFTRRLDSPVPDQITHDNQTCRDPFWSRSGDRIYYTKGSGLWSIAAIGGAPERVLDNLRRAALAPDGASMAVARFNELAFGKLGGADWKPYRKPPFDRDSSVRALQFSPDGTKLAVLLARINFGQGEIWLVPYPLDRGAPHQAFAAEGTEAAFSGLSWMPDSRNLVVSFSHSESPEQLFLGDSETGKLRKLTTGLEARTGPAVSPDGLGIAYVQESSDNDVVEITLDKPEIRPVLATARSEASGAWLPNGREFVYASDANGPFDLWVRSLEESRARPLLPRGSDMLPHGMLGTLAVAPDGERLAVEVWGAQHTIWAFRRSGGKAVRIDPANLDHHSASWSPDGNWIAYARVRPQAQLMKAPAGGGAPVVIATSDRQGGPTEVSWSPAGDWIAWAPDGITLYSPDGKQQKKLIDSAGVHRSVGFSPDGKTLYSYYLDRKERKWMLDAFDIASGRSQRIGSFELDQGARLQGFQMHPDGKRFLATLVKSNPDIVLLEGF